MDMLDSPTSGSIEKMQQENCRNWEYGTHGGSPSLYARTGVSEDSSPESKVQTGPEDCACRNVVGTLASARVGSTRVF